MRAMNYCRTPDEREALTSPEAETRRMKALSARDPELIIELNVQTKHADRGGAEAARRVAELYELADDPVGSRPWWRVAADLGDPAAETAVQLMDASAPAAAPEVPNTSPGADDRHQR